MNKSEELRFPIMSKRFIITMTFGITLYEERSDIEKLITLADERMYYGKIMEIIRLLT